MTNVTYLKPTQNDFSKRPNILVIDDDVRLRDLLKRYLLDNDFAISTAANASEARDILTFFSFDAIVLDIMMPGENGFELAKYLRATPATAKLPILLLTARGTPEDRITGLEIGADDYLGKPFEPRELVLRLNAILRRLGRFDTAEKKIIIQIGKWRFDSSRDELQSENQHIKLTEMESNLLRILAAEPATVLSRADLAERSTAEINDRTIDVQITRLRRKIEVDPKAPRYILTIRGEGYCLMPEGNMR